MVNKNNLPDQDRVHDYDHQADYAANHELDPNTVNARPATEDEIAYRNGYAQGQERERVHDDVQRTREENSAATGIVLGVLIASVAGLVLAMLYFLPQNRQPVVAPAPVTSPQQPPQALPSPAPAGQTTIIQPAPTVAPVPNTQIIVPPSPQPSVVQPNSVPPSVVQPEAVQPDLIPPQTQPEVQSDLLQPGVTQPTSPVPSTLPDGTVVPTDPYQQTPQGGVPNNGAIGQ